MADIWTDALKGLQPRLGSQTYDLWLRPIVLREVDGDQLRLAAPSRFMKDWFENHYLEVVLDELRERTDQRYGVQIDVDPELAPVASASAEDEPGAEAPSPAPEVQIPARPEPAPAPTPAARPVGLSDRYVFDTFIKGAGNELAASAAWAVAQDPGTRFNPLFIYGGVGLGKTHLLHAIGHALYARRNDQRIMYLSAERFMNEFVTAVRFNEFDAFRRRYREDCDVLLIDDIQFIAGRDRTMDEFFHVFNALHESGKQIVVAADRVPADMDGMEERLTSRLNWGLVADIKPPDLETRMAILRQKADNEAIRLQDDVALSIAKLARSNVRELEGALVRVATFASLRGKELSEPFVREVLGKHPQPSASVVTVEAVQKLVASHFAVRIADLKGPRRHKGISRPRMIAMYLARQLTGASFPEIGLRFSKDHSTVINACKRIDSMQADDADLRHTVDTLRRQLNQN